MNSNMQDIRLSQPSPRNLAVTVRPSKEGDKKYKNKGDKRDETKDIHLRGGGGGQLEVHLKK